MPVGRLRLKRMSRCDSRGRKAVRERRRPHRGARVRVGLNAVSAASRCGVAQWATRGERRGIYHSIYDDSPVKRFSDTDFAMADSSRRRRASSDPSPDAAPSFEFAARGLGRDLRQGVEELASSGANRGGKMRQSTRGCPRRSPIRASHSSPEEEDPVPFFDFSPLQNASAALTRAARPLRAARKPSRRVARRQRLDRGTRSCERRETLRGRRASPPPVVPPLFYAPGFYRGYAVKTFPPCERRSKRSSGARCLGVAATAEVLARAAATSRRRQRHSSKPRGRALR